MSATAIAPGFSRVTRTGFTVTGLSAVVSNDDPAAIGALWGRWFDRWPLAGLADEDAATFAVYDRYQGDHTAPFRLTIGRRLVASVAVRAGLTQVTVPGGDFLELVTTGDQPAAVAAGWARIWREVTGRCFVADVDRWPDAAPGRAEILVGVWP
ncbi:hypothetical protein GCM10011505_20130 [Tistrella bauzanensis]|uniref:AraC family transcriptional regulator n=1 Tax=Tistrella bauzanensis TaxID=657419 RepID=A0ABQ1IFW3_9PROT|nr:GyrI-like domain-containing protein [Tistrella bauzanensis]GGB38534.1 hypothetical protein GCM10011505_20130 [Tistrella bauzanensis]